MNSNKPRKFYKSFMYNEDGQVLLFVIVAMSIALAVGVAISIRTLSSLQRATRTDTASKVYSGAEGGAEAFIVLPDAYLEDIIDDASDLDTLCDEYDWEAAPSDIGRGCIIDYQDPETGIVTEATVTASYFQTNTVIDGNDALTFFLDQGSSQEILIQDGTSNFASNMMVCWDSVDTHLYIVGYNQSGNRMEHKLIAVPGGSDTSEYDSRFAVNLTPATVASPPSGYPHCVQLAAATWFTDTVRPYGIRLKALRASTNVAVLPGNLGNFPNQGFLITSRAEISTEGITKSVKTVKVYKTYSFMPNIFDYAIYSEGPIVD